MIDDAIVSSDMAGRAFCVTIQLDVHAITCPGVWLCPNGRVALKINALNSCAETRAISPILPLLFHDKFVFDKIFVRIASLTELQRTLEQEFLYAELVQWVTSESRGITLATFETNLSDLLYPTPCFKGLLAGVDVDLLMEPTKYFPGIIAPKIEISTKTVVEEVPGSYDSANRYRVINPKLINSKQTTCGQEKRSVKGIIRQRRVCHTKSKPRSQSCRPYRQRSSSVGDTHQCPSCSTSHQTISQTDQCYHLMRKNRMCTSRLCLPAATCDNVHVKDNCPVCLKYNCYFPKCYDDSDVAARKYVDCRQYDTASNQNRNFSDNTECCRICGSNGTSELEEKPTISLLQSKIRNLQKSREKLCIAENTAVDNFAERNSAYEFTRDNSSHGFYKNLEKFYKRMYKQAKIRAQEIES